MLIIHDHIFYVTNKFIKFTQKHKIVYLCLSAHLTYLLQPFNISVFGF